MSIPQAAHIRLVNATDYRDAYANSIQIRVSVWDFLLIFGRLQPVNRAGSGSAKLSGDLPESAAGQGVAGRSWSRNVRQYEGTFGEIKLDPIYGTARTDQTRIREYLP